VRRETVEAPSDLRVLTSSQLALLAAVQDRLIPRYDELSGAGEAGAATRVDGFLAQRPDWRPDLIAALQALEIATDARFLSLSGDEQDAALRAVEASHPHQFRRLLRLTYTAYYSDATAQRAGGYAIAPPQPKGHALEAFDESRLEAVKRRGKLWRDA
jgi:hypothetical protein